MGKKKGKNSSAAANRAENILKNTAPEKSAAEQSTEEIANDKVEVKDESERDLNPVDDLNATTENFKGDNISNKDVSSEFTPTKSENSFDQVSGQSSAEVKPLFNDESNQNEISDLNKEEPEQVSTQPLHIQEPDTPVKQSSTQDHDASKPELSPGALSPELNTSAQDQSNYEEEKSAVKVSSPRPEPLTTETNESVSRSGSRSSKPTSPRPKPPSVEGSPALEAALKGNSSKPSSPRPEPPSVEGTPALEAAMKGTSSKPSSPRPEPPSVEGTPALEATAKESSSKPSSPRPVPPTPTMDAPSVVSSDASRDRDLSNPKAPPLPPRDLSFNTPSVQEHSYPDSEEVPGLRSFHKIPSKERNSQILEQDSHSGGFRGLNVVSPVPINFSDDTEVPDLEKPKERDMVDVKLDNDNEATTLGRLATPAKLNRSRDSERNVGKDQSPSKRPETRSPISPPLPPRGISIKRYSVPPPLEQEMKSDEFRKSLALADARDTTGTPPPINRSKRLESAAEINLIANRFRETRQSYQTEGDVSRENIEKGQSALKTSFSTFLESLPATPVTPNAKFEEPEIDTTPSAHTELHEDELHLLKTDWSFWTQVVNDFGSVATNPEKLEQKIADGIPSQIRGIIWQLIANSKSVEFEDIYNTLRDTESPHERNIRRDMKRTKFIPEDRFESLFNVIKVYSVFDPDVGYTQGMAFIVTPLLLNTETEAEAFGLLIRLMKGYGLRTMYLPEMPGLMLMLYQFDRLLEENSPQLYNHLTRQGVRSSMYATQWFLTFFAYKFPLEFVLRIYDIVFVEGMESFLRFAVNLMLKNIDNLLDLQFDKLLDFLKEELFFYYLKDNVKQRIMLPEDDGTTLKKEASSTELSHKRTTIDDEEYDVDRFVHDAMNHVHITPISLRRYNSEYDEIHEIEQQKEAQYESMRIKNHQLHKEVRKLEHGYTLLNREHVDIANELIKNRLKIETLSDENNDMKTTILELRKQLSEVGRQRSLSSPDTELPSDIRHDLNRTIRRNAEVMSENLSLQDRVTELEKELATVKTKRAVSATSAAAANIPRDKLTNSWSGFKKVFKKEEANHHK